MLNAKLIPIATQDISAILFQRLAPKLRLSKRLALVMKNALTPWHAQTNSASIMDLLKTIWNQITALLVEVVSPKKFQLQTT
jgi:hypothetical protein